MQAHDELTETRNGSGFYNVYEISSRPLDIFDFSGCVKHRQKVAEEIGWVSIKMEFKLYSRCSR